MAGSVEKRGENSWRLTYSMGFDAEGKRIRKYKTVKATNKKEAEKLLAQFIVEVEAGEYISPEKMKFGDFVEEWEQKYARKHLSPTTLSTYKRHLKNRILPVFGDKKLDQIKPLHILGFLDDLENVATRKDGKEGTLSSSTIEYHYRILSNIFKRAVEWQLIKTSPIENVKKPKRVQKETSVYNNEQAEQLFYCLKNEELKWRILIKLAVTTGMRRGELLGLEWKHINLEKGTIQIKQTVAYVDKQHIIKEPKTKNSVRTVTMPESLLNEMDKYQSLWKKGRFRVGDKWEGEDHEFLFCSWHGKPMHPTSITTWWGRFKKKNSLPDIRFHDLRHTSATLLINGGVHAKIISARLGHADIRTTMNIYGHALQEADTAAAEKFEDLFGRDKKGSRQAR